MLSWIRQFQHYWVLYHIRHLTNWTDLMSTGEDWYTSCPPSKITTQEWTLRPSELLCKKPQISQSANRPSHIAFISKPMQHQRKTMKCFNHSGRSDVTKKRTCWTFDSFWLGWIRHYLRSTISNLKFQKPLKYSWMTHSIVTMCRFNHFTCFSNRYNKVKAKYDIRSLLHFFPIMLTHTHVLWKWTLRARSSQTKCNQLERMDESQW